MSLPLRRAMALVLAGGFLAAAGAFAHGQVGIGIQLVTDDVAESDPVGDPWWDDAAPPEADKPAKPADEAAVEAELVRQQYEQQAQATLRRELSVVRQTCPSLEKQQRALVLEAGRQAAARLVQKEMAVPGRGRRGQAGDAQTAVGEALQASVEANATAEEAAAYAAERGLRKERAKQATIAAIVADVDRDAFLDDAERETLAKALGESYRERWRQAALALQQGIEPGGPPLQGVDRCVEKALGNDRKAEWLARREQTQKLLAQSGARRVLMNDNGGMVLQVNGWAVGGAGGGVRVIQRRAFGGGVVGRVQVEVQGGDGDAAAVDEDGGAGEQEK